MFCISDLYSDSVTSDAEPILHDEQSKIYFFFILKIFYFLFLAFVIPPFLFRTHSPFSLFFSCSLVFSNADVKVTNFMRWLMWGTGLEPKSILPNFEQIRRGGVNICSTLCCLGCVQKDTYGFSKRLFDFKTEIMFWKYEQLDQVHVKWDIFRGINFTRDWKNYLFWKTKIFFLLRELRK